MVESSVLHTHVLYKLNINCVQYEKVTYNMKILLDKVLSQNICLLYTLPKYITSSSI